MTGIDINQALADNLRAEMKRKGLTQTELGQKTGMGQTTVSLYLRPGDRKPGKSGKVPSGKLSELGALAEALGCEPWELLAPGVDGTAASLDWRTVALTVALKHPHEEKRRELTDFVRRVDAEFEEIKKATSLA